MARFGYCRSRALWDEARHPEATYISILRAILYEMQPVRVTEATEWYDKVRSTIIQSLLPSLYELGSALRQLIPLLCTQQFIKALFFGLAYYGMIRLVHA
jgi:hypothetical protein